MNVFADLHHDGLYYSLYLLFEKRLGFKLFRPIGMEWFREGYWAIARPYNDNIETVKQFLSLDNIAKDGTPRLNTIAGIAPMYYEMKDFSHDFTHKAVTIQQFAEMNIDYIVASIPDHWQLYTDLRDRYHPNAKVICHMGNMFMEVRRMIQEGTVENLMAATIPFQFSQNINSVFYHEEQPLREYSPPQNGLKISSFVNVLPKKEQYEQYKHNLSEFEMKAYGAASPDGIINTLDGVYDEIQKSGWIYHVKPGGDGYGWVWHSAFMLGRPVITNFSDYRNKLGGVLFEDGVTGIDLDKGTMQENCNLIRNLLKTPEIYTKMCESARKRFVDVVHYDEEEQKVRQFLDNCV